jgi:hypothetical protein
MSSALIEDLRRRIARLEASAAETPAIRAKRDQLIANHPELPPGLRRSLAKLPLADVRAILQEHAPAEDSERAREKARIDRHMGILPSGPAVRREGRLHTFSVATRRKDG